MVGTLPKSLAALGFDARIITPYHRVIKEKYAAQVTHLTDFYIDLGWRHQYVGIERLLLDGIVIYLVDNEFYFGDRIYLGGEAEGEQYAFSPVRSWRRCQGWTSRPRCCTATTGTPPCCPC